MKFLVVTRFKDLAHGPSQADEMRFSAHLQQPVMRIHLAGALYDDRDRRSGIMMIIEAETAAQVGDFVATSPFKDYYGDISIDRIEIEVGAF